MLEKTNSLSLSKFLYRLESLPKICLSQNYFLWGHVLIKKLSVCGAPSASDWKC